ncbi:diguanylate cyclase [Anaerotalea alkaliphila]|uniref:Diguanylate cyclase n=1 Tax=Anaerotalea alkaliphila TaxID=2662126 RepID=A0A7X5KLV8_9FIRM|nr:diguanylate cyclase [Anaerotalea alkaliphila]NDL67276.1 diguanylate cyclase [Anaerotalea alkaliphila]
MVQIIKGLLFNMATITSIVMFANMLMHEKHLSVNWKNNVRNGFLSGILGCILMLLSVPITDQVIIDFRCIPVILMALYVSFFAAMETALVIGIFRLGYFGVNRASLVAFGVVLLAGVACGLVGRTSLRMRTKWLLSVASVCLVTGVGIHSVLEGHPDRPYILLAYLALLAGMSTAMHFFTEYIAAFNRKIQRIREEAEVDHLTGLKTPRQFERNLKKHLAAGGLSGKGVSLLYIDIDYFKNINDRYGHSSGDLVLQELGAILKRMGRSRDIVFRKGGEEFTMLLVDCGLEQAALVAERIRKAVEEHGFQLPDHGCIHISVSIGVAALEEAPSAVDLLERADRALYRAKQAGRNQVMVAGEDGEAGRA